MNTAIWRNPTDISRHAIQQIMPTRQGLQRQGCAIPSTSCQAQGHYTRHTDLTALPRVKASWIATLVWSLQEACLQVLIRHNLVVIVQLRKLHFRKMTGEEQQTHFPLGINRLYPSFNPSLSLPACSWERQPLLFKAKEVSLTTAILK